MNTLNKTQWLTAYRHARMLNCGTLFTTFGRELAFQAMAARDHTRLAPVLTARMFRNLGYYARGFRRI